jgi:hypothetical protein
LHPRFKAADLCSAQEGEEKVEVLYIGTADTKGEELLFLASQLLSPFQGRLMVLKGPRPSRMFGPLIYFYH